MAGRSVEPLATTSPAGYPLNSYFGVLRNETSSNTKAGTMSSQLFTISRSNDHLYVQNISPRQAATELDRGQPVILASLQDLFFVASARRNSLHIPPIQMDDLCANRLAPVA
jgi:hypothetical protein